MITEETLVPPNCSQPPLLESKTATPVFGSATAATSVTVRFLQPLSVCQGGLEMKALQPLLVAPLVLFHTVSIQLRVVVASFSREVPLQQ
jgi:hypothetical protein